MGKKLIRLTESELIDSIKKIVLEQKEQELDEQNMFDYLINPTGAAVEYAANNPQTAANVVSTLTNPVGTAVSYWNDEVQSKIKSVLQKFQNPQASPYSGLWGGIKQMIDRSKNVANMYASVKNGVIVNPSSKMNGMKWVDYMTKYNIRPEELQAAKRYNELKKQYDETQLKRYQNIMAAYNSVNQDGIIANPSSAMNGTTWYDYCKKYNITPQEVEKAKEMVTQLTKKTVPVNKATTPQVQQKVQAAKQKVDAIKQGKKLVPKGTATKGQTPASSVPQIPQQGTAVVGPQGVTTNTASYKPGFAPTDVQNMVNTAVTGQAPIGPQITTAPAPTAQTPKGPPPGNFVMQNAQAPVAQQTPDFLKLPGQK